MTSASSPVQSNPIPLLTADFWQETFALTRRLFIQLKRRPTTLLVGIIQPLLWLILFGALFQNAPAGIFGAGQNYTQFLGAGVIVFTAFGGALNAGVPVIFDREFGFLNRLLVAPLTSRFSIVLASSLFIVSLALLQTAVIVGADYALGAGIPDGPGLAVVALIVGLLVLGFTALSLGLAFAMPGHQQLLAFIFLVNLPLIFSSTALAPLSFMPTWLRWVASLNPLTFAIEPIRHVYRSDSWSWADVVLQAPWGDLTLAGSLGLLTGFVVVSVLLVQGVLRKSLA
ncbi:ABC transporter permease [Thermostichus sp. MS-CIW-37]|jgi:ABC-2 type transport system permease protein